MTASVQNAISGGPEFWLYEKRNEEGRGQILPLVWEWPVAIGALIIVVWVSILRLPWGTWDYVAFVANAALAFGMVTAAISAGRIRRQITTHWKDKLSQLDA